MNSSALQSIPLLRRLTRPCSTTWTIYRGFSSTHISSKNPNAYPQFLKSSSPELDAVLLNARRKVLLPDYVSREQRRIMTRKENQARLELDPVYVKIGGVEESLQYIDMHEKGRNIRDTMTRLFPLAKSSNDWENIARFIKGLNNRDNRGVAKHHLCWLARTLIDARQFRLLMQLVLEGKHSGFAFHLPELRELILVGLHGYAAQGGWQDAQLKKAIKYSEKLIDLAERTDSEAGTDLKHSPFILASPLAFEAVEAIKFHNGADVDGNVLKYATRLMSILQEKSLAEKLQSVERRDMPWAFERSIAKSIILWHALKRSMEVLGSNMPNQPLAKQITRELEKDIQACWSEFKEGKEDTLPTRTSKALWEECHDPRLNSRNQKEGKAGN